MIKKTCSISVLLFVFSVSSAQAAVTYYTSESNFLAGLGSAPVVTYDFDSMASGSIIANGDTVGGATFSYSLSGPGNPQIMVDSFFDTTSTANYLGTDDGSGAFVGGDSFTITFDQTIQAIGLYVISADLIFDDDFTLTTNSGHSIGNSSIFDVSLTDGAAYYIGLIEDDAGLGFNSITLSSFDAPYLFNVDDISTSVVPVPAAVWLFGSGLLCLVGLSKKSRKS